MSELIVDSTDASFEADVLKSAMPVLVDFWAPWCGPCIALTPLLEQYAEQYAGKVKFVKLNVDENLLTRDRYGVRGLPLLALFSDGNLRTRLTANTSRNLLDLLQSVAGIPEAVPKIAATKVASSPEAIATFNAQTARKEICLARLRESALSSDEVPSRRMADATSDSAMPGDLPNDMNVLVNELWDVSRKTRSRQLAEEQTIAILEATPVGVDLKPVLLEVAYWLLHDPRTGVASYLTPGPCADLFQRLGALHRAELDGAPVSEDGFEKLRKSALSLTQGVPTDQQHSPPPHEQFNLDMTARLERSLAVPLADVGATWAFTTMLVADIMREEPLFLLDSELEELRAIEDSNRLEIEAAVGPRPINDKKAQADRSARYAALQQELQSRSRDANPGLYARQDAWGIRQMDMAAELARTTGNFLLSKLPTAPALAIVQ